VSTVPLELHLQGGAPEWNSRAAAGGEDRGDPCAQPNFRPARLRDNPPEVTMAQRVISGG